MNLKELSRLLNLSATTVSRALNGYPEVNAATRARVIDAARRHGYAPNQVAKRLATGRTMAIGYVVPLAGHTTINPIFADFILGAGETYSALGYDMVLSIVPAESEGEAYETLARQHKVDGVMVHTTLRTDRRVDLLRRLGLPFLLHGRDGRTDEGYPWLDIDNRGAFRHATQHLLDLGHRRIALVNGLETMTFACHRREGYAAALAGAGLGLDPDLMRAGEMTELHGHASVRDLFAAPEPPTAFLCSAITIALGALRAVRELGLEPGRDVSIITHDDDLTFLPNVGPDPTTEGPLFTATRSSIRAAGRRCAEMLIERIREPDGPPPHELWQPDFVQGSSTGPCPRALP
jgi:LacI family transcriptional regulator